MALQNANICLHFCKFFAFFCIYHRHGVKNKPEQQCENATAEKVMIGGFKYEK